MSDDGLGPKVAHELIKRGYNNVVVCGSDLSSVLTHLDDVDLVIVIDIIDWRAKPGTLLVARLDDIEEVMTRSSHNLPITGMLKIMKRTLRESMEIYIIGVQPERVELGDSLTPPVECAVREVIAKIEELLAKNRRKKANT